MRNKIFRLRSRREGFTLIELLVVIAIIGLLATIAIVALNSARQSSRDAKRIADVRQVQTGLEMYYNANSKYVYDCTGGAPVRLSTIDTVCAQGAGGAAIKTYLAGLDTIVDPSSTTACTQSPISVCDYSYDNDLASSTYVIYFWLEGATGSFTSGSHTASPTGIL